MKLSLAICAIVRNESAGIDEWIQHYLARGVSHFFIIDDASDDGCCETLKKHESLGYLTLLTPEIPREPNRQDKAYNEFIKPLISRYDWVAVLDADEFLWDSQGFSLLDYLSEAPSNISMINVQMSDFGDNGHIKQPQCIVNSFTKRAKDRKNPHTGHLKSIFRPNRLLSICVHISDVFGDCVVDSERLRLNHYKLQSLERWNNLIIPRGSANCVSDNRHSRRFFKFNMCRMRAIEDLGLINQNQQFIKKA